MAQRPASREGRSLGAALFAGVSVYALQRTGPLLFPGGEINYFTAGAASVLVIAGARLAADAFWYLGDVLDWLDARLPRGIKGTAGWVTSLRQLRHELIRWGWGPYWGSFKGRPLFSDFASNALVLGPSGSGKDTGSVGPNILAIRESKTCIDLKGDETVVYANALRKRGEIVHILNIGEVFADILGPSSHYNPLHLIADSYWRRGGLQDVSDDVAEASLQVYPEPKEGGGNDNKYFRDGSRTLIAFAVQMVILIKGYEATLGDVLQMLSDRQSLLHHALWACGRLEQDDGGFARIPLHESPWASRQSAGDIETYTEYLRGQGSGVADLLESEDSRTADSFLTGATQALSRFNITTRAHKVSQQSSFRFSDQKDAGKVVTVFLVADSSRMEAQRPVLEMIQFCMLKEWKRHPNKKKPVYLIGNEAGNFKLYDLASLLTWGRAYSIKLFLYLQSLAAFRITYGPETLKTLLSEREILQILPGQSDPETLSMIEDMLGQRPVMTRSHGGRSREGLGLNSYDLREDARPLLTADEIRRLKKTILFIRSNKPALVDLPSIAAIWPWRSQQAVNPFYGKPYRLPIKLWILRWDRRSLLRGFAGLARGRRGS